MSWLPWSSDSGKRGEEKKSSMSWIDSINATDWEQYKDPKLWIHSILLTATGIASIHFYRSYLRRLPGTLHIEPARFRKRSLFGKVTSVGDGDNFHLFHTPGGRLAGWGWARKVPTSRLELKGRTIPVRIAGIDAPEAAHFGRPAQPFSGEALSWLSNYILNRRVRAYIYKRDQYDRVVGTVFVRRFFLKRDVGLEMLKRGLATTYEAKTGAEFGGLEAQYKAAEAKAKAKRRGMWAAKPKDIETPRAYKNRMAEMGLMDNEKRK